MFAKVVLVPNVPDVPDQVQSATPVIDQLLPAATQQSSASVWLLRVEMEALEFTEAVDRQRGLTPCPDEHPLGLLVRARLDAAQGDFEAALATQRSFPCAGGWRVTDEPRRWEAAHLARSVPAPWGRVAQHGPDAGASDGLEGGRLIGGRDRA